jgi:hypothetical protein
MLARWIPVYQGRATTPAEGQAEPAEGHLPVPVVAGHGLSAVTTVVRVLLSALGIGS